VSITIGALVAMHTSSDFNKLEHFSKGLLTLILIVLPIVMIAFLDVGFKTFKRECRRMYEQSSIFFKLEERLGFWEDRDADKMKTFPKEKKYFSDRIKDDFDPKQWDYSKEFIDTIMSREDTLYGIMKKIFNIFTISGFAIISIIIIVSFLHMTRFF